MAQQAVSAGSTMRRRAFFGLFDADGWSWASVKAFVWFVAIIFLLAYIPDRAYYITTASTIELGILAVSPVNLCPPENESLPCPAPAAAVRPWHPSPTELALPGPRTDGAAVQAGTRFYYVGGSDGQAASDKVFVTDTTTTGNIGQWREAPALPQARVDAAAVFLSGSIYVIGGTDASGGPTDTVWVGVTDQKTGDVTAWEPLKDAKGTELKLPAPRTGAAAVATPEGLIVLGGSDANGPTSNVWNSALDKDGKLGAWTPNADLAAPRTDVAALLQGDSVLVLGGADGSGPTSTVLRGTLAKTGDPKQGQVTAWATGTGTSNLPAPRTNAAVFSANAAVYLVGGADSQGPRSELYWAVPNAQGVIPEWKHLPQSDLPAEGLAGTAAVVSAGHAFLIGGTTANGVTASSARSNLAPRSPFFQLGLVGATVPGLKITGEIGEQLGWLAATLVGGGNFTLLLVIAWAMAHKEKTRELVGRFRARRRRHA